MRVLSSQSSLDYIEIDGIIELVGSSPAYCDGLLRVAGEIYNGRGTGSTDIGPLGDLIGGFALVFGGKGLHDHTVIGVGSWK